jgi:hypothetical protein
MSNECFFKKSFIADSLSIFQIIGIISYHICKTLVEIESGVTGP